MFRSDALNLNGCAETPGICYASLQRLKFEGAKYCRETGKIAIRMIHQSRFAWSKRGMQRIDVMMENEY